MITAETAVARSAGERLDHGLAIQGLLHSEGWLGLDRPVLKGVESSRGSPEPEPCERGAVPT